MRLCFTFCSLQVSVLLLGLQCLYDLSNTFCLCSGELLFCLPSYTTCLFFTQLQALCLLRSKDQLMNQFSYEKFCLILIFFFLYFQPFSHERFIFKVYQDWWYLFQGQLGWVWDSFTQFSFCLAEAVWFFSCS